MPIGQGDAYAKRRFPHSLQHLDQIENAQGTHSALRQFLYPFARQSASHFYDNFDRKAIDTTNYWTASETGTGTTFAVPATTGLNGTVVGVTGATSGNCETLYGTRNWAGDNNCWFEIRFKIDVVTNLSFETGLIDSASDLALPTVSDVDTPALAGGTSDLAVVHLDTSQTLTTAAFVTDGSTANMNTTAYTLSPVFTPTADTFHIITVGLAGDIPFCMVDGARFTTPTTGVIGQRVEGGTLLRPFFAVRARSAAAKTATIDYVALGQDRAARTA